MTVLVDTSALYAMLDTAGQNHRRAAMSASLAAVRASRVPRGPVSFELMRRTGIDSAFAFDADFAAQGFGTVR